jgi:hypothetical protein
MLLLGARLPPKHERVQAAQDTCRTMTKHQHRPEPTKLDENSACSGSNCGQNVTMVPNSFLHACTVCTGRPR